MSYGTIITVGDANERRALGFSCIEVWASTDEGSTYAEITAPTAQPASLPSFKANTMFALGGMALRFSLDGGAPFEVVFDVNHPYWTPMEVVARINQETPCAEEVSGTVVITGGLSGRQGSVEVLVDEGQLFQTRYRRGKDARPLLQQDVLVYPYTDLAGYQSIRYKWRFSHAGSNPISPFSERVMGDLEASSGVPVSIGTARFSGLDGRPLRRRLLVSMTQDPMSLGGALVGDSVTKQYEADETGFVQAPMAVGAKVKILIEGTAFVRDIIVPNVPTFDILTAMAAAPDPYSVQSTPPLLTRRHL